MLSSRRSWSFGERASAPSAAASKGSPTISQSAGRHALATGTADGRRIRRHEAHRRCWRARHAVDAAGAASGACVGASLAVLPASSSTATAWVAASAGADSRSHRRTPISRSIARCRSVQRSRPLRSSPPPSRSRERRGRRRCPGSSRPRLRGGPRAPGSSRGAGRRARSRAAHRWRGAMALLSRTSSQSRRAPSARHTRTSSASRRRAWPRRRASGAT